MLSGNFIEQRRQHVGTGDVRIVAGIDFSGAPALLFGALIELPEAVVRRNAAAIDVVSRQSQRPTLKLQFLLESLCRLRQPQPAKTFEQKLKFQGGPLT